MLDKMQRRGLIRRERIDADQRVCACSSPRGRSTVRAAGPATGLLPDAWRD